MKKAVMLCGCFLLLGGLVSCKGGGGSNSGGSTSVSTPGSTPSSTPSSSPSSNSTITLEAFSDFSCTSNWTNRDGALGLKAGSGNGTCTAKFPGTTGTYSISLKVQAERDGSSPYKASINGSTIAQGNYPYACGGLQCNSSSSECPDRNKIVSLGTHSISSGASIQFWGAEVYPCGTHEHGAYAKWHRMTFKRIN